MTDAPDLEMLEALLRDATPGPWIATECMDIWIEASGKGVAKLGDHEWCSPDNTNTVNDEAEMRANAELFLAAINALPVLIAALRAKDPRIAELEAKVARLEGALRPFADAAVDFGTLPDDYFISDSEMVCRPFQVGWFRAAQAALTGSPRGASGPIRRRL